MRAVKVEIKRWPWSRVARTSLGVSLEVEPEEDGRSPAALADKQPVPPARNLGSSQSALAILLSRARTLHALSRETALVWGLRSGRSVS